MERVLAGELFHDVIVEMTRTDQGDVKWNSFRILDVNDTFTAATDYDSEEVIGHGTAELNLLASAARHQIRGIALQTA
jgi:PAS domain-containing protein